MHSQASFADTSLPALLLPDALVFKTRSARFLALSEGHAYAPWLALLARLNTLQQNMLETLTEQHKRSPGKPLDATRLDQVMDSPLWQDSLRILFAGIPWIAADTPLQAASVRLSRQAQAATRLQMHSLFGSLPLQDNTFCINAAEATLLAAALQVSLTTLLGNSDIQQAATGEHCPLCGHPPIGSIIHHAGASAQRRYLQCSVCSCRWHAVRARCTICHNERDVSYQYLQDAHPAVRAECCDHCQDYLKEYLQEKDAAVDPYADDMASLDLDLLLNRAGYARRSVNLMLLSESS